MRLDPSRIAAQIVTGIGFLGAGMIFIQKNTITGLTTAAGIWATAGIGMAIGCEMYFIGIMCTGVIVFIQFILHKNSKFLTYHTESNMSFVLENNPEALDTLLNKLRELDITILDISYNKNGEMLDVTINVQHNEKLNKGAVIEYLYNESEIKSAMI
jgi:putative Mg2+ transporter-C (MgtC) family protein